MGKDLKGRELGKGIVQRKDGRCYARFTRKNGERMGDCFATRSLPKNGSKINGMKISTE